jgi:hypothetical protein
MQMLLCLQKCRTAPWVAYCCASCVTPRCGFTSLPVRCCISHCALVPAMPRLKSVTGTDTSTGQNVALLTRIDPSQPLARSEERVNFPVQGSSCGYQRRQGRKFDANLESSGVSKHFTARFSLANPWCNQSSSSCAVPALGISLIAAHLVSKPVDPRACSQREAQATGFACSAQSHVAS